MKTNVASHLAVMAVLAMVAINCSGPDSADLSPALTVDQWITADPKNESSEFLDAIPKTDSQCLEEIWGVDRYTAIRSGDANIDFDFDEIGGGWDITEDASSLYKCLSGETWARFVLGDLLINEFSEFNELRGLSTGTVACFDGKIAERGIIGITSKFGDVIQESGRLDPEDIELIMLESGFEIMPALVCLNEDERREMDEVLGFDVRELECLLDAFESAGIDQYAVMKDVYLGNDISPITMSRYELITLECGDAISGR